MVEDNNIYSPDTLRANRIPPGQKLTNKFPVLHYGPAAKIDASQWKFSITGLLGNKSLKCVMRIIENASPTNCL